MERSKKNEFIRKILFEKICEQHLRANDVIRSQEYNTWFTDEGINHTEYLPVLEELANEGLLTLEKTGSVPIIRMKKDWLDISE